MKEETTNNNHIVQEKNKIILNKDIDLYKIPIKKIKESKLSAFKGDLLNELLTEMTKSGGNNEIFIPNEKINDNQKKVNSINNIVKKSSKSPNKIVTKIKKIKKIRSTTKNSSHNSSSRKINKLSGSAFLNNKTMKGIVALKEFRIEKIIFQMKYNTQMGEDLAVIGSIDELGSWDQGRPLRMGWNDGNIWKGTLFFYDKNIIDFEYKFLFISKGQVKQWEDGNNRKFILSQIKGLIESCPNVGNIIHLKNISGQNIDYNYNDYILTIICEWNKK